MTRLARKKRLRAFMSVLAPLGWRAICSAVASLLDLVVELAS
jgi:hypothetical protein